MTDWPRSRDDNRMDRVVDDVVAALEAYWTLPLMIQGG